MLSALDKPEYWFNPPQVLRRLSFALRAKSQAQSTITLPWGMRLTVNPYEAIGLSCCTQGIYDLPVTEALFRLIDPGETCADVGANIGHMTSAMAHRTGPNGLVISFEPYAPLYKELVANLQSAPNVCLEPLAASSSEGTAYIRVTDHFASNRGTGTLCKTGDGSEVVKTIRLEDYLGARSIGVMKIDVEGHELEVLIGCGGMLKRAIRDIVFEEHNKYPAETHLLLEKCGYALYRIERTIFRPVLLPPESPALHKNMASNFLATRAPDRAKTRFSHGGWWALRARKTS